LNERKDVRDKQAQDKTPEESTSRGGRIFESTPKVVLRMFLSNLRYSVDDQALKAFMDSLIASKLGFVDVTSYDVANLVSTIIPFFLSMTCVCLLCTYHID
jgi:hypothetical protein